MEYLRNFQLLKDVEAYYLFFGSSIESDAIYYILMRNFRVSKVVFYG